MEARRSAHAEQLSPPLAVLPTMYRPPTACLVSSAPPCRAPCAPSMEHCLLCFPMHTNYPPTFPMQTPPHTHSHPRTPLQSSVFPWYGVEVVGKLIPNCHTVRLTAVVGRDMHDARRCCLAAGAQAANDLRRRTRTTFINSIGVSSPETSIDNSLQSLPRRSSLRTQTTGSIWKSPTSSTSVSACSFGSYAACGIMNNAFGTSRRRMHLCGRAGPGSAACPGIQPAHSPPRLPLRLLTTVDLQCHCRPPAHLHSMLLH